ncbi:zinc finger protein 513-like isoform 1-T3 [Pholidichthys leucotaenia]
MPRRKQTNPQPVKLDSESGAAVCDSACLVLESDFLLSEELQFGDSEILGLDKDAGVAVFSLSVDDDSPALTDSAFPPFLSCKGCGQIIGDATLGAGLDLGLGLGAELYCLTCEGDLHRRASSDPSPLEASSLSDGPIDVASDGKRMEKAAAATDIPPKLYSCSLCTFASRYSNHLKRHMRIHDGQKPFRCPICPYASTQLVNLQRHARTHTGEKPYRCHHCSYACSSLGNLRRHQRMHEQERPQRRGREKRRGRRKKMNEENHGGVSDLALKVTQDPTSSSFLHTLGALGSPSAPLPVLLFPLCCRTCGLTLEEADLEGDKAEVEGDGGQMCRRCSENVSAPPCSPDPSRRAKRGTKLYRCPHCPFLSHYPNHLTRHSLTHSEEKPHCCPHCPYTSSHLDNLKRHLRVHTGEKPYRCPACSYACGNPANLRRHELIHSGAKPFRCDICGYSCNQSMNLKRHMLRHTGEKPYACAECSYTTGHWDNYKRHQRKHGHDTDSWDKHSPIHSLGWGGDAQDRAGQGSQLSQIH